MSITPSGSFARTSVVGQNSRQRRAAKVRKRAKARPAPHPDGERRSQRHGGASSEARGIRLSIVECFLAAVWAQQRGEADHVASAVARLAAASPPRVAREIATCLEQHVDALWEDGWQPADLDRLVVARLGPQEARLARWVIAAQSRTYEIVGRSANPGWMAQLERIGAQRHQCPDEDYLCRVGGIFSDGLAAAVALMGLLTQLPRLPRLVEPPRRWRSGARVEVHSATATVLGKVRALLAKAESTTFDAEADAFTAKAQELMARHRIDRAMVEHDRRAPRSAAIGRRMGVDDPYAEAKALMLGEVAAANGCHAVWSRGLGFSTVFGFPDDLDAVEELFTSLLVQATLRLRAEGSKLDRNGRTRTTRFRRSFLVAFGVRIGRRLRETVAATVTAADSETSVALVPILAARDDAVKQAVSDAFPEADMFSPSASDGEGWYAGTLFGDVADLGTDAVGCEQAA